MSPICTHSSCFMGEEKVKDRRTLFFCLPPLVCADRLAAFCPFTGLTGVFSPASVRWRHTPRHQRHVTPHPVTHRAISVTLNHTQSHTAPSASRYITPSHTPRHQRHVTPHPVTHRAISVTLHHTSHHQCHVTSHPVTRRAISVTLHHTQSHTAPSASR